MAFGHFYSTAESNKPSNQQLKETFGSPGNELSAIPYAGYNFRLGQHAIIGIDGSIDFHSYENLKLITPPGAIIASYNLYKEKSLADARLRLGYAQGRFLPYIAGGLSILRAGTGHSFVEQELTSNSHQLLHNYKGWNLGAGIDYAACGNMFIRLDYRFSQIKISNAYAITNGIWQKEANYTGVRSQQLRLGAAYKF